MNDSPAAGAPASATGKRISWLRLIRTENVGPATFRDLINRFGSAETALEMPELMMSGGAARLVRIPTADKQKRSWRRPENTARASSQSARPTIRHS